MAVALGACGDDAGKRAQRAADSLKGHQVVSPPNMQWKLAEVTVETEEKIVMTVGVDSGTEVAIGAVGRILQSRFAERACPSATAQAYKILGEGQVLWVRLRSEKNPNLIEAVCKP